MTSPPIAMLRPRPPDGSAEQPFRQLDWLIAHYLAPYANPKTRKSMIDGMQLYYKRFLMHAGVAGSDQRAFTVAEDFHSLAVYDYFHWLKARGLAPFTIKKVLRELAALIKHAVAQGWIAPLHVVKPEIQRPQRATALFDPYSIEELNFIARAIQPGLARARQYKDGYVATGVGYDPRTKRHNIRADGARVGHWSEWNNIVWYFEHVLQYVPRTAGELEQAGHGFFVVKAHKHHGGLDAVYRRLGVVVPGTPEVVLPLLIKLAWETGLNPSVLYRLKRDCFQAEHPLTGQPYLRYYKERSQGEADLHLALFDVKPFPNGQLPDSGVRILTGEAARLIRQTIDLILCVTEPLRSQAAAERQNDLFLIRRNKASMAGASSIAQHAVGTVCAEDLRGNWCEGRTCLLPMDGGSSPQDDTAAAPRYFNLARFRSTLADRLVREGVDFFAVQAILGHSKAQTTADYLRNHLLEAPIRQELDAHLQKVHRNMQELDALPKPYATADNVARLGRDGVIYKGVLCDCKDVYAPPANIRALLKQSVTWEEGKPCAYYDMCLLCDNLLITRRSLPMIVKYKREIEESQAAITPGAKLYAKKLAVLEDIMQYFPPEDLAWAEEAAHQTDVMIDPLTYQGHQDA